MIGKEKILVVDDEVDICEILAFNLQNEGYEVLTANSAEQGLQMLAPDCALVLLDVMMGGMSGFKMAERMRRDGIDVPIIFLTARDTENDTLTGFSVGGDDYIAKPFSIKEVLARVRAVLKRHAANPASGASGHNMRFGELTIDPEMKEARVAGENIALTKTEFGILELLAQNPARVFSREEIIERLWTDAPYVTERTVDVHITRLRKKLGDLSEVVTNRPGFGYRFNNPA